MTAEHRCGDRPWCEAVADGGHRFDSGRLDLIASLGELRVETCLHVPGGHHYHGPCGHRSPAAGENADKSCLAVSETAQGFIGADGDI